jgi:hypothetical protein
VIESAQVVSLNEFDSIFNRWETFSNIVTNELLNENMDTVSVYRLLGDKSYLQNIT